MEGSRDAGGCAVDSPVTPLSSAQPPLLRHQHEHRRARLRAFFLLTRGLSTRRRVQGSGPEWSRKCCWGRTRLLEETLPSKSSGEAMVVQ